MVVMMMKNIETLVASKYIYKNPFYFLLESYTIETYY